MKLFLKVHYTFLLFAIIPIILSVFYFFSKMQELDIVEERVVVLKQKLLIQKEAVPLSEVNIKNSDHFYIDKHIETMTFLEPEMKRLQIDHLQDSQNEWKNQRVHFLQNSNQLLFAEENMQQNTLFQEVIERQQRPVEINEEDLKKLLSSIEGLSIGPYLPSSGRPQLFIQSFEMIKKPATLNDNIYVLNMQLIKREEIKK